MGFGFCVYVSSHLANGNGALNVVFSVTNSIYLARY